MVDLPQQSSFIPKRTTSDNLRRPRRQGYLPIAVLSYACLIAAPVASFFIFLYQQHVERQFDEAVIALDESIVSFKQADMETVLEFSERLTATKTLLDSHISLLEVFAKLEANTATPVAFTSFALRRPSADRVLVDASLTADTFNTALFQRAQYGDVPGLTEADIERVAFTPNVPVPIAFNTQFEFASADIRFAPESNAATLSDVPVSAPLETTEIVEEVSIEDDGQLIDTTTP